jgi:hypothetical protein
VLSLGVAVVAEIEMSDLALQSSPVMAVPYGYVLVSLGAQPTQSININWMLPG